METPNTQTINLDEALKVKLLNTLDYIGDTAKNTVDTIGQEAPEIVREIATYGAVYHTGMIVMALFGSIISVLIFKKLFNRGVQADWENDGYVVPVAFAGVLAFVMLIGTVFTIGSHADPAIKATVAPRIYVVEYVSDLVTGRNRCR